jgi:RimJ/RimL family protein N-acetyltransferase
MQTLTTPRLIIREFTQGDLDDLYTIMRKIEVMYAWEHGFTRQETLEWIERQITRYHTEGIGYCALIRQADQQLIGQVGLLRNHIVHEDDVEIAYILDNTVWHQGYATEACQALLAYAFHTLHLSAVYTSIRPLNVDSIRVAERIGMRQISEHVKIVDGKEMPHLIFCLNR